jgi:hypothetical protein
VALAAAAAARPVGFPGLPWDAGPAAVERALAEQHFERMPSHGPHEAGAWRGVAFGVRLRAEPQFDRRGRLIAVDARPDAALAARTTPLERYDELVVALRRHFGPWDVRIPAGRPVEQERLGRFGVTRTFGPRTAATIWTGADGAAAIVQLDGEASVGLRFESPRWEQEHRTTERPDPDDPIDPPGRSAR